MAEKIKLRRDHGSDYEPTDSEEEYSEEEKEILKEVRKGRPRKDDGRKELMAFADSDDEDDDDEEQGDQNDESDDDDDDMVMRDSDIEGAGDDDDADMPNEMDWGKKSRNYYNTDFVDPDYSSYTPEQEELAKQEEEEARAIQQRLAKEMTEKDFQLDESLFEEVKKDKASEKHSETAITTTKLKADFSGLSKREKQQLFQKDSPEFAPLVNDFREFMKEVDNLHNPVLEYVKQNNLPFIPAFEFTEVYRNLALTYCSNISFYLLLKTKRISVRNHPIAKRLAQFKNLLLQLQDKYKNIIRPQLEALLERIQDGDRFEVLPIKSALSKPTMAADKKKGSKLSILNKYDAMLQSNKTTAATEGALEDNRVGGALDSSDDEDDGADEDVTDGAEEISGDEDEMEDDEARRGITYEIAKNKGLTPHRKKEMRNPRVKHRNRFRKALIRRKGAVRTVRKETKRYGGEISGIKATVSKSVKFKS